VVRIAPQRRSSTALRRAAAGEGTRLIVIALLANLVIAVAKLMAGLVTPLKRTVDAGVKLVPRINKVKPGLPGLTSHGAMPVTEGTGLFIAKVAELDCAPPGLKTVTFAVPADAISAALIAAVTLLSLTNVVVRSEPFHRTIELLK